MRLPWRVSGNFSGTARGFVCAAGRRVLGSTALIGAAVAMKRSSNMVAVQRATAASVTRAVPASETVNLKLRINGRPYPLAAEARVTLLDALRERLGLTGAKKGCDHGQ